MKIPAQMQPVYEEIAGMIEEYCEKYMNEEYRVTSSNGKTARTKVRVG